MPTQKAPLVLPEHTIDVQIRFSDTDMMGHVSSMSYGQWTEVARTAYFAEIPEPPSEIPWFVMSGFDRETRKGIAAPSHLASDSLAKT